MQSPPRSQHERPHRIGGRRRRRPSSGSGDLARGEGGMAANGDGARGRAVDAAEVIGSEARHWRPAYGPPSRSQSLSGLSSSTPASAAASLFQALRTEARARGGAKARAVRESPEGRRSGPGTGTQGDSRAGAWAEGAAGARVRAEARAAVEAEAELSAFRAAAHDRARQIGWAAAAHK